MAESVAAGEKSSLGMDANLAGALSYVLGIISGLLFFLLEKQSRFVRFHALQAILFSVGWFVLSFVGGFIPILGVVLSVLLTLGGLIAWVLLMVKAYQGEYFKLPIAGDIAEKNATLPQA